jgi:hypothetical protein
MRFLIERWNEAQQGYDPAAVGDSGGVSGEQAIARAFEDAGIETVGCYAVRPEIDPDARPAFYNFTINGELIPRDAPCM